MTPLPRSLGVFCGPSLMESDRLAVPGVTYLPPAARGDVARAAERFDALLLIDGVFHHDIAPSPKEVYAACRAVSMFGSASMGALRAAECRPFGMVPLGIIARWYVNGVIDGDDEVAVLVHPETQRPLTVPSVNVRYVAWLARRRDLLTAEESAAFVHRARAIFYMDRGWDDVIACAPAHARTAIGAIAGSYGDLKRMDALFSLRTALRTLSRPLRALAS